MSKKQTNKKISKKVEKKDGPVQPELLETNINTYDQDEQDIINLDNAEDEALIEKHKLRDDIVEEAKKIASNQISHCYDLVQMGRKLIEMEKEE